MKRNDSPLLPRGAVPGFVMVALFLAGCSVTPKPLNPGELEKNRTDDLHAMFAPVAPVEHPLTLAEVVARALRFNLDHRVKVVEAAQAMDLTRLDKFDLLPKLAATSAYSGRSNPSASSSRSMITGDQSLEISTSQEREHVTADLDLTWNILDFGVSYFNARQNADRQLIARERERKVIQNLVQEARSAYWRALAAQELQPQIDRTIRLAESALEDARKAEAAELRSPLESLRYRKALLENLRQLESMAREMATARVDLAAMMTLPPATPFKLAVPGGGLRAPSWTMPLEQMEESALLNQPDMREMAYQGRIVVDESRKSLLKLFPGISLGASRKRDNNAFTLNKDWYETSVRVTGNLLGLLSIPDQLAYNRTNEQVMEIKRLALRMALLSQVHVSWRQYDLARTQLGRAGELFSVESRIARHMVNRAENDAQSVLDRIASDTSAILAQLRLYNALAQTHNAVGRMMATTGLDPDVGTIGEGSLEDLAQRVSQWLTERSTPAAIDLTARDVRELSPPAEETGAMARKGNARKAVRVAARVRAGAGMQHRRVRLLRPGSVVTVKDASADGRWSMIAPGEWVASRLLHRVSR